MVKEKTFRTKNGDLTKYALACGYIQKFDNLELSIEQTKYHVKGVNYNNNKIWEIFDTLKEAKKFIKAVIKTNKINS